MVMFMHLKEPIVPIRYVLPEVSSDVATIVEQCLNKDVTGRPASARDLVRDFLAALRRGAEVSRVAASEPSPETVEAMVPAFQNIEPIPPTLVPVNQSLRRSRPPRRNLAQRLQPRSH